MKTLCKLKKKDIARQLEAVAETICDPNLGLTGYLCRDCLRFSGDKKRLCDPVSLRKLRHEAPPTGASKSPEAATRVSSLLHDSHHGSAWQQDQ